jgi:acyl carrier protein
VEDRLFPESRKKMKALGLDLISMKSAFPRIERSLSYPDAVIGMCMVLDKDKVKEVLGIVTAENEDSSLEGRVRKLEQEKAQGLEVDTTDVDQLFSVDEIARMDNSLVERIYDLISDSAEEAALLDCSEPVGPTPDADTFNALSDMLCESFREVLQLKEMDREGTFQAYGLDSIMAMRLSIRLSKMLGMEVSPHKFLVSAHHFICHHQRTCRGSLADRPY